MRYPDRHRYRRSAFGASLTGICRMTRRTLAARRHAGIGSHGSILQPVRAQQRLGSVCAKLRGRGNLPKPTRPIAEGRKVRRGESVAIQQVRRPGDFFPNIWRCARRRPAFSICASTADLVCRLHRADTERGYLEGPDHILRRARAAPGAPSPGRAARCRCSRPIADVTFASNESAPKRHPGSTPGEIASTIA